MHGTAIASRQGSGQRVLKIIAAGRLDARQAPRDPLAALAVCVQDKPRVPPLLNPPRPAPAAERRGPASRVEWRCGGAGVRRTASVAFFDVAALRFVLASPAPPCLSRVVFGVTAVWLVVAFSRRFAAFRGAG